LSMHRLVPLAAVSLLPLACAKEPPAVPTWEADVYPIIRGNCGHCHGETVKAGFTPTTRLDLCDTKLFIDRGLGTVVGMDAAGTPQYATGAAGTITLPAYVSASAPPALRMPPPPASPLYDYEIKVLERWAAQSPRDCSKKSPNTKPTAVVVQQPTREGDKVVVVIDVSDPDGDQVMGTVKLGSAPDYVIPGAGRRRVEFTGVQPNARLAITLFDGYESWTYMP
jgi:hypothetical protein